MDQICSHGAANAATDFAVPHPTFNDFALVAMIVPTRMCLVQHPLNCLATPLVPNVSAKLICSV